MLHFFFAGGFEVWKEGINSVFNAGSWGAPALGATRGVAPVARHGQAPSGSLPSTPLGSRDGARVSYQMHGAPCVTISPASRYGHR